MLPTAIKMEQFSNGITREWLYEGQIAVISTPGMTRNIIDSWVEVTHDTMLHWPQNRPYLVLQDFSRGGLTPYGREQAKKVTVKLVNPSLRGRYALLLSDTMLSKAIMYFVRTDLDHDNAPLERSFFTNRELALRWLAECL